MAATPEFRNNVKSLADLIKFMPSEILYSRTNTLSWYVSPYDHIAIRITGGSKTYHHANIIFKGDGHLKIYFYTEADSEISDPYIANLHFSKHREISDVQNQILGILIKHGGFEIGRYE